MSLCPFNAMQLYNYVNLQLTKIFCRLQINSPEIKMYETPEPTTSSLSDKDDNLSTEVKAPDEVVADVEPDMEPDVIKGLDVLEAIEEPLNEQKDDTSVEEIRIVAVASAVTDESINKILNVEQEIESESNKSIKSGESESTQVKQPSEDRSETRVISLDTIIRKGLNEQMPMTAKDIDNIVPNAIKQQQDADLKQSEKLEKEREFALVYESSDDYNSSGEDKFDDELIEDVGAQKPNEVEENVETETSQAAEEIDDNENENRLPQSICETLLDDKPSVDDAATDLPAEEDNVEEQVEATNLNSNESNGSITSDHSFDDFDSESDSTQSSQKKRKRRKSTSAQNIIDDANKKLSDETVEAGDETGNDPGPRLNRRGKPRKSYDETDNEQVKKRVGKKLKIQRYSGPKRPGVRVSENDPPI